MKKISLLIVFVCAASLLITGCSAKKSNTINYQGRLKKYMHTSGSVNRAPATIDLSEGPKLEYGGHLGPNDMDFDFKIKNPY